MDLSVYNTSPTLISNSNNQSKDLITPYQYPLVDRVPRILRLTLIVGSSYYYSKLLPKIRGIVVRRYRGETGLDILEGRLLER